MAKFRFVVRASRYLDEVVDAANLEEALQEFTRKHGYKIKSDAEAQIEVQKES